MSFALSRTMRLSDYQELAPEIELLKVIEQKVGGAHPAQHQHRAWEYSLLIRTIKDLYGDAEFFKDCWAVDFACGVGLGGAILLSMGCAKVRLTETWTCGDWSDWQVRQMRHAVQHYGGSYELCWRDMVREPESVKYQAALCVSSLEHIPDWQSAARNMASATDRGGMVFLTMDYCNDGLVDNYAYKELRAQIFDQGKMMALGNFFHDLGFEYPESPDWGLTEDLVNNYGFASLVMVKDRD